MFKMQEKKEVDMKKGDEVLCLFNAEYPLVPGKVYRVDDIKKLHVKVQGVPGRWFPFNWFSVNVDVGREKFNLDVEVFRAGFIDRTKVIHAAIYNFMQKNQDGDVAPGRWVVTDYGWSRVRWFRADGDWDNLKDEKDRRHQDAFDHYEGTEWNGSKTEIEEKSEWADAGMTKGDFYQQQYYELRRQHSELLEKALDVMKLYKQKTE